MYSSNAKATAHNYRFFTAGGDLSGSFQPLRMIDGSLPPMESEAETEFQQCGEEHPLLCSDPEGEIPLKCGLPKGHTSDHQDQRDVDKIAINDYVCPSCGNEKCSRNEVSCWKCGNLL